MDNKKNYKFLYQKYKNKYLKLKKNMKGGVIIISLDNNLNKKCPVDTLYIPKICHEKNFECLKKDGLCYNFNNEPGSDPVKESNIINNIFSTEGKPVIVRLTSFDENIEKDPNHIIAKIGKLLISGTEASIFTINDFSGLESQQYLIKLSRDYDFSSKLQKYYIENPTSTFEDIEKTFPDVRSRFRSFKGLILQSELNNVKQINSIYDFGRFSVELNSDSTDIDMKNISPIGTTQTNNTGEKLQNKYGTYSLIERCLGGDFYDRYYEDPNFYKKNFDYLRELIKNILIGLNAIHSKGYVHMDIKPENIGMAYSKNDLTKSDIEIHCEIRILDFGFAHLIGKKSEPKGTKEYLSPELQSAFHTISDVVIHPSLDMFALGMIMYELIHGFLPLEPTEIIYVDDINNLVIDNGIIETPILYEEVEDESEFYLITFNNDNFKKEFPIDHVEDNKFKIRDFNMEYNENIFSCKKYVIIETNLEERKIRSTEISFDIFGDLNLSNDIIELLEGLLNLDPDERFSAQEALNSKFILDSTPPLKKPKSDSLTSTEDSV